jgi:hypothetical protein|tara:strand:- start:554 stop:1012 length:459 start_codon:yes stop_codon:yes gene_type:complete
MKKDKIKSKGLFDHINHIRKIQSNDYYDTLSEEDEKTFNIYMILRVLSMDPSIIDETSYLSKYIDSIPKKQFYKLCISVFPKTNRYFKYIKSKNKSPNEVLIECICNKFQIGKKDATDYHNIICSQENGKNEFHEILMDYGYNDKEIKKILK